MGKYSATDWQGRALTQGIAGKLDAHHQPSSHSEIRGTVSGWAVDLEEAVAPPV